MLRRSIPVGQVDKDVISVLCWEEAKYGFDPHQGQKVLIQPHLKP